MLCGWAPTWPCHCFSTPVGSARTCRSLWSNYITSTLKDILSHRRTLPECSRVGRSVVVQNKRTILSVVFAVLTLSLSLIVDVELLCSHLNTADLMLCVTTVVRRPSVDSFWWNVELRLTWTTKSCLLLSSCVSEFVNFSRASCILLSTSSIANTT